MHEHSVRVRVRAFIAGVAIAALSGAASADPPSRVARLGFTTGSVSLSPAGESDWVRASINRPLTTGDRLWADTGARAEIQVGGAMIRMDFSTGMSVLNLDDLVTQLRLTQGTLIVHVDRLEPDQALEIATPNLAFVLREPGAYRIEVDPANDATTIVVRSGRGEVYGGNLSYTIDSRQPYRFWGTELRDYEYADARGTDEFDRWASERDRRYDNSVSARYVSRDVIGYQDLDANGSWRVDATYGNVWVPSRVPLGWAPYRDGHWAWIDPWGWTWIDDAPWGFAVSHYGRWAHLRGSWFWVPGPVRTRAYYAPALVVFVGGDNFRLSVSGGRVGGVAWFPLAPREVYRPAYPVSRAYYENVNRSNTVINVTVINNTYNNVNPTKVVHANRGVPGAVVAVPTATFAQSQPVSRLAARVSSEEIGRAAVATVPPVAPTRTSVHGAAPRGEAPPDRIFERPVVVRATPPAARAGFAAQQQRLATQPGRPLGENERKELNAGASTPTPVVNLVAPAQPSTRPPSAPPREARPEGARARSDERATPAVVPGGSATNGPSPGAPPTAVAPPGSGVQAPQPRGGSEQPRVVRPPRGEAVAPPTGANQVQPQAAPPQAAPPQAAPPRAAPPQAAPPRAAPPQAAPPRAAPPQAAPPQAAPRRVSPPPAISPQAVPPQGGQPPAANPGDRGRQPPAGKPVERRRDGDEERRGADERKPRG